MNDIFELIADVVTDPIDPRLYPPISTAPELTPIKDDPRQMWLDIDFSNLNNDPDGKSKPAVEVKFNGKF